MNIDIEKVTALVHAARPLIMDEYAAHEISVKGLADFVTKVDTSVQHFLLEELGKLYPDVQLMGEEEHMHHVDPSKPMWILDPIDGTLNLIYGYRHSAISLGYYEDGHMAAAVVYNPFSEETFHAVCGEGAFLNGNPIRVTENADLKDSMISIGTSPYDKELAPANFKIFRQIFEHSLDIRRSGSAALDLCYVACGRLDGYFERNLKPWDFAAGSLIVEEAGGTVTDIAGRPLKYVVNQNVLASNTLIHSELQSYMLF